MYEPDFFRLRWTQILTIIIQWNLLRISTKGRGCAPVSCMNLKAPFNRIQRCVLGHGWCWRDTWRAKWSGLPKFMFISWRWAEFDNFHRSCFSPTSIVSSLMQWKQSSRFLCTIDIVIATNKPRKQTLSVESTANNVIITGASKLWLSRCPLQVLFALLTVVLWKYHIVTGNASTCTPRKTMSYDIARPQSTTLGTSAA